MTKTFDPVQSMAEAPHEFGEWGGVNMSIEASTTFTVMDPNTMPDLFGGAVGPQQGCYLYGRHFNPTVFVLGRQLAAMEGTEVGYGTASGISAIAASAMQICDHGDHAVVARAVYGGTFALFGSYLPKKAGIQSTFVDHTDLDEVAAAMTDRTKLIFVETVSNPTMQVADIKALADLAHARGAKLVVDNTFCPMMVSPAQFGADVVVHSLTKFISGASDIIGGAICASQEFLLQLMDVNTGSLMLLGPTMDPKVAHELSLRLPHLGLRMQEHSRRAQIMAERLQALGYKVGYPGLDSHPQKALLESMANPGFGLGGLLALDVGSIEKANELMQVLQNKHRFGYMAVSLGFFDTLMSASATSTSSELPEEELKAAGISKGLLRMSVGYTGDLEVRWAQLKSALDEVMGA